MITVFAVNGEEGEVDDVSRVIMDDWELLSIDDSGFELKLNFPNPLYVS